MDKELKIYLDEIILKLYSGKNAETINSYKKYSIVLSRKETKINESYKEREITIYNLFRCEAEVINSLIIGLAHHIDFCNRGFTNNKKEFVDLYKSILHFTLNYGYLDHDILITSNDYKNIKRIRDALENYWQDKTPSAKCKMEVYNSYKLKKELRQRKYKYSYIGRCWYLVIDNKYISKQIEDIKKLDNKVKIEVVNENKMTINIAAMIVVSGDTYFVKDILKSNGFRYEDKSWKKKIKAADFLLEKKLVTNVIPKGQGIRVTIEY
ncbi:MAG: hypothetical protein HFF36_06265 [Coprobacillus sp.]|nr:hypothetical protein [Coprobacillus sp.]